MGDCVTEVLGQLATCTSSCRGRMEEGGSGGVGAGGRARALPGLQWEAEVRGGQSDKKINADAQQRFPC